MKILIIFENILDQLLKISKFQDYVNRKANIKSGMKVVYHSNNTTIDEVFSEYKFNDVREDDIVLDIGANVGGFSLFISKMVNKVYAVEPELTNVLEENIKLNKINNIVVLNSALGNIVNWSGTSRIMIGNTLPELIQMCGGHVDFLKCDCEGGEWIIQPNELKGIRRIEIEVHNLDGSRDFNDFLKILDEAGFRYTYKISKETDMLVHATRKGKYEDDKIFIIY